MPSACRWPFKQQTPFAAPVPLLMMQPCSAPGPQPAHHQGLIIRQHRVDGKVATVSDGDSRVSASVGADDGLQRSPLSGVDCGNHSPTAFLYTKMVVAQALPPRRRDSSCWISTREKPLALQLAVTIARPAAPKAGQLQRLSGYERDQPDVGCPRSERVQIGRLSARCLIGYLPICPAASRRCPRACRCVIHRIRMRRTKDPYAELLAFVDTLLPPRRSASSAMPQGPGFSA